MKTASICPGCGKPLCADAPQGVCPECLLKAGLATGTGGADLTAKAGFIPPSLEDLAPLFPQFEILSFLGHGGMGAVYKARQKQLDRIIALKILPPGFGRDAAFAGRFAREARAMAKLNHPGIVTIYDFGLAQSVAGVLPAPEAGPGQTIPLQDAAQTKTLAKLYFFIMEFVDGVSLRQLLQTGRIAPREALAIVPQICDALQYAHDQGIVHRDIKPENILLDRQGRVKVADFGLAKLLGTEPEGAPDGDLGPASCPNLTDAGKVMGTPRYMAPEQAEHPAQVDGRADIYALGVVFYQMLTGELPGQPLDPPSRKVQIDVRLDEVVLRALEKEPDRRYQQVSQVRIAVDTILHHAPSDASQGRAEPESRVVPADAPTVSRTGGWPKYAYFGAAAGLAGLLAFWLCLHLWLRPSGTRGSSPDSGPANAEARVDSNGKPAITMDAGGSLLPDLSHVSFVSTIKARPQPLNIDFGVWQPQPSPQTGPAAAGCEGDFWNAMAVPWNSAYTEGSLKLANGDPSPVEVEMINLGGGWHSGGGMGVKSPMLDTFNYPMNNQGGNSRVILHMVPPGKYDLYLYGHKPEINYYGDYTLTVGERSYGRKTTFHPDDAGQKTAWVEGSQYVRFAGVKIVPGDDLEILIRPGGEVAVPNFRNATSPHDGLQTGSRTGPSAVIEIKDQEFWQSRVFTTKETGFRDERGRSVSAGLMSGVYEYRFADAMICGLQLVPAE